MIDKDILLNNTSGKHIVVMRRGHFYKFDVLDNQGNKQLFKFFIHNSCFIVYVLGNILEPQLLLSKLQYILKDDISPSSFPIGVLTTAERNNWAELRNYLIQLGNEESLRTIDESLMIIALDDEKPGADPLSCVKQYLHADGTNRYSLLHLVL